MITGDLLYCPQNGLGYVIRGTLLKNGSRSNSVIYGSSDDRKVILPTPLLRHINLTKHRYIPLLRVPFADFNEASEQFEGNEGWLRMRELGREVGKDFCGSLPIRSLTPTKFNSAYNILMLYIDFMLGVNSLTEKKELGDAEFTWPVTNFPNYIESVDEITGMKIPPGWRYLMAGAAGGSSVLHAEDMLYDTTLTHDTLRVITKSTGKWKDRVTDISKKIEMAELI